MSYSTPFSQQFNVGNYQITMPATVTDATGTYAFIGWQDGFTTNPRTVNLQTDISLVAQYTKIDIPPDTATLSGIVTDSMGPVTDALVNVGSYSTLTAADGSYSLTIPLGQYIVIITKQGYVTYQTTLDASASGGYVMNVPLTHEVEPIPSGGLDPTLLAVLAALGLIVMLT